ncbi:MAG TPA: hypothetical protein VN706_04815 [Gemmatimonadaceae bacterium]|nr:hypothetical protein [Gemmatimonadaceae bacterium]
MKRHRVLIWRDPATWFPIVRRALLGEKRRRNLERLPRAYAVDAIADALSRSIGAVRLFHGCRPEDVSQYYSLGFIRHADHIVDRARHVLGVRLGLSGEILERAIADTQLDLDRDRIFFVLDDRALLRYAGHYLIYGSESIMAIAATAIRLGGPNLQPRLRNIGIPTLFTCDVPWTLLDNARQSEIADTLYDEHRVTRGRQKSESGLRDHTVILRCDVPASVIVSHHHPPSIADWHESGRPYVFSGKSDLTFRRWRDSGMTE